MKTNAARILDRLRIRYELREYEIDPDDLAEHVAAKIGLPPEQVFKTLGVRGERHGVCSAVIPGSYELDLKALAAATADKKVELVPLKEVPPLTGYIRGGVTALGCKKDFPVYADETIEAWDLISISAIVLCFCYFIAFSTSHTEFWGAPSRHSPTLPEMINALVHSARLSSETSRLVVMGL
jgi:Cys-tRNA(Pro)/Cys-tRNA(Cys) deacylase